MERERRSVFIAGGTGYMGQRLISRLLERGHEVRALVRSGSEKKLPACCTPVFGNALDGESYAAQMMGNYIAVRTECEDAIEMAGLNATILRPWYVLGPGHWWPYLVLPIYKLAELLPSTREGAQRLGLVTLEQMTSALTFAVENPAHGRRVVTVPEIRRSVA